MKKKVIIPKVVIDELEKIAGTLKMEIDELIETILIDGIREKNRAVEYEERRKKIYKYKSDEILTIVKELKFYLKQNDKRIQLILHLMIAIRGELGLQKVIRLKGCDIKNNKITVKEDKELVINLDEKTQILIKEYLSGRDLKDDEYLFNSRKHIDKHISRQYIYHKINHILENLDYDITAEILFRRLKTYDVEKKMLI